MGKEQIQNRRSYTVEVIKCKLNIIILTGNLYKMVLHTDTENFYFVTEKLNFTITKKLDD